jgi:hypothetical protein
VARAGYRFSPSRGPGLNESPSATFRIAEETQVAPTAVVTDVIEGERLWGRGSLQSVPWSPQRPYRGTLRVGGQAFLRSPGKYPLDQNTEAVHIAPNARLCGGGISSYRMYVR